MSFLPGSIHIPRQLRPGNLEWTFENSLCRNPLTTHHPPPVVHGFHMSNLRFTAHDTDELDGRQHLFPSFTSASTSTAILLIPSARLDCIFTQHWDDQKGITTFTSSHVYNRHFAIFAHIKAFNAWSGFATGLAWGFWGELLRMERFWFGILLPWAMTILNELLIGFRAFYFYLFVWYGLGFSVFIFKRKDGRRIPGGAFDSALLFSSPFLWGLYPVAVNWKETGVFPFRKRRNGRVSLMDSRITRREPLGSVTLFPSLTCLLTMGMVIVLGDFHGLLICP